MTVAVKKVPSRGRLFKLFTDLGPYFRKLQSTENSFFFDCLEVCVDDTREPEEREFYGWWLVVYRNEESFEFERFNGLYNSQGEWVAETLNAQDKLQVDNSFELFIEQLKIFMKVEIGSPFDAREVALTEA